MKEHREDNDSARGRAYYEIPFNPLHTKATPSAARFARHNTRRTRRRMKYVVSWDTCMLFIGHAALVAMYIPNVNYNKGFPFHKVSSAMLGLVQGQSASEYLRDLQANGQGRDNNGERDESRPPPQQRQQNNEGALFSVRQAKSLMKSSGIEMYQTMTTLKGAAEDLITTLRDLDDYEGEDISFSREQFRQGGSGGQSMADLEQF